jgi:hypothetical protein
MAVVSTSQNLGGLSFSLLRGHLIPHSPNLDGEIGIMIQPLLFSESRAHPSLTRNLARDLWSATGPGTGTGAASESVRKEELFCQFDYKRCKDLVWHITTGTGTRLYILTKSEQESECPRGCPQYRTV